MYMFIKITILIHGRRCYIGCCLTFLLLYVIYSCFNQGIAIVVLDLNFKKVSSNSFDTWGDASSGNRLRDFVKAIPNYHIFIGVTADSAERYLTAAKV